MLRNSCDEDVDASKHWLTVDSEGACLCAEHSKIAVGDKIPHKFSRFTPCKLNKLIFRMMLWKSQNVLWPFLVCKISGV